MCFAWFPRARLMVVASFVAEVEAAAVAAEALDLLARETGAPPGG
jgi:hypothetical protein